VATLCSGSDSPARRRLEHLIHELSSSPVRRQEASLESDHSSDILRGVNHIAQAVEEAGRQLKAHYEEEIDVRRKRAKQPTCRGERVLEATLMIYTRDEICSWRGAWGAACATDETCFMEWSECVNRQLATLGRNKLLTEQLLVDVIAAGPKNDADSFARSTPFLRARLRVLTQMRHGFPPPTSPLREFRIVVAEATPSPRRALRW
jgi:hypothetical protein